MPQTDPLQPDSGSTGLPFALGADLACALALEPAFGQTPSTGWHHLSGLSRFDLAPIVTHRPIRHLGAPALPATSLPGLSSVTGRLGMPLQDSLALYDLLELAFSNRFAQGAGAPILAPLPAPPAPLVWQKLVLGRMALSAALLATHHNHGDQTSADHADLFTGLRVSTLQLHLDPSAPPLLDLSLIGQDHRLLTPPALPALPPAPPVLSAPVHPPQLVMRVAGRDLAFPVQLRLNLSSTPARPHYSLGRARPDRISLAPGHITAAVSVLLSDARALGWARQHKSADFGATLRLGRSAWLALDAPAARILASRHTHRGGADAVLCQLDLELGAGTTLLLARSKAAPEGAPNNMPNNMPDNMETPTT